MSLIPTVSLDDSILEQCERSKDGTCTDHTDWKVYHYESGNLSPYCCSNKVIGSNLQPASTYSMIPIESHDGVLLQSGDKKAIPIVNCEDKDGVLMCRTNSVQCADSRDTLYKTVNYSTGYMTASCGHN